MKNSLLRARLRRDGQLDPGESVWVGPTIVAWGGESIEDLSKAVEAALLKDDKQGQSQGQGGARRRAR